MLQFARFCAVSLLVIGCQHSGGGQLPDGGGPGGVDSQFPVAQGSGGVPLLPTLPGVQQTVDVPLSIDSSIVAALEAGLALGDRRAAGSRCGDGPMRGRRHDVLIVCRQARR